MGPQPAPPPSRLESLGPSRRYPDAATESIYRERLVLGLPTGHPVDRYLDPRDTL